jgi:hypothetical protein
MSKIILFSVCLFSSLLAPAQDFQWLRPLEVSKMVVADNGDIYLLDRFNFSRDVDPSANEWILTGGNLTPYIAKFDSDWNLAWAYVLKDVGVTDIKTSGDKLVICGTTSEGAKINSKFNDYTLEDNHWFAAQFNSNGNCTRIINTHRQDATMESGIVHGGNLVITGRLFGEVDFDMDPNDEYLKTSYGDKSGYIASYSNLTKPDWVMVFQDYGTSEVQPIKMIQDDGELILWGKYTGQVDFEPNGQSVLGEDTIPNTQPYFVARFNAIGELIWVNSFVAESDVYPSDFQYDQSGGVYLTGIFQDRLLLGTDDVLLEGAAGFDSDFIIRFDQFGDIDWYYALSNSMDCKQPSVVLAPEGNSIWWVGSVHGSIDLDPTAGQYEVQTNPNPNTQSLLTHLSAAFITEIDQSASIEKINYFNTETEVYFMTMMAHPNQDYYLLYGGSSNRNFDHDFGLAEYFDPTLTRSYIAKYDGVRIPEALSTAELDDEDFHVFPNPSSSIFFVNDHESIRSLFVRDVAGRSVPFSFSNGKISLTKGMAGIYFLQMETKQGIKTKKVIFTP